MIYLQLEYLEAEYYPDHWYHKEAAVVDPNWTFGNITEKTVSSNNIIHACYWVLGSKCWQKNLNFLACMIARII